MEPAEEVMSEHLDVDDGWPPPRDDVHAFCNDPAASLLLTTTEAGEPYQVEFEIPLVDDEAWEMTLSDGTIVSGDHGLHVAGAGPLISLSQSDSQQSEPLVILSSGGVYHLETADGSEYMGYGERDFDELPSGSLQGEFSARFWADPAGIMRGDPPDFTSQGTFETCPEE